LQLSGEGSVLIASSSGLESAHESERMLGSFFTHHLVAALRGAADTRGDGVVTLADAFTYARERTVRDTAAISLEPQHPSFFMNLRGRADLPLATIDAASTLLAMDQKQGPLQVIHLATGLIVLEIPAGRRTVKLSMPPGRYLVRRHSGQGTYASEINLEAGSHRSLSEGDLIFSGAPAPPKAASVERPAELPPLAVNHRALTLPAGLAEVDAGLLIKQVPSDYPHALLFVPTVRYGVSDQVTVSVSASGSFCVDVGCSRFAAGLNAGLSVLAFSGDWLDIAPHLVGGYEGGFHQYYSDAGLVARVRGWRIAFIVTPQLEYRSRGWISTPTDIGLPFTIAMPSGPTYSVNGELETGLTYRVGGQIVLQATDQLSVDVSSLVRGVFSGSMQSQTVPLTLGAAYAVTRRVDVRVQLTPFEINRQYSGQVDHRSLGLFLAVRP
jgi:hypothetical protein